MLAFPFSLKAQTALTGNIFDRENRTTGLEGVAVRNLTNKTLTLSNKDGHFVITAKVGDLVSFAMVGYEIDTVYLINLFPKNMYLRVQVNTLNTVNVTGTKLSPYLSLKDVNAKPARQVDYNKNRGGLRLTLGYDKYRKENAKIQELEENAKIQEEINKNFNEVNIKELVKFEGSGIKDFIAMFRPTVNQVKDENPFNYAYYALRAYSTWLKIPQDQRKLPALPKLKANH